MESFARKRAEFECEDRHQNCAKYAERGDCSSNVPWMVHDSIRLVLQYNQEQEKGVIRRFCTVVKCHDDVEERLKRPVLKSFDIRCR